MTADEPPEDVRGSHGGWDQVAETAHRYEAELMALRLREHGIEAAIVDQTFRQEPLPGVRAFAVVRLVVPMPQAEQARRILAEGAAIPADAEQAE